MTVFLMDNGSLHPQAVWSMRAVARSLASRIGHPVHPVSVLHSNRIEHAELGGIPAAVFREEIQKLVANGETQLRILPFFLGPSNAIREYIPLTVSELGDSKMPRISIAHPLCRDPDDAEILARAMIRQIGGLSSGEEMILVDHGTPRYEVHQVREWVRDAIAAQGIEVRSCSMESREGEQYAFNRPLLKELLQERSQQSRNHTFAISLLFLLPGRHAGAGGDVDTLCREALSGIRRSYRLSGVLGETAEVLDILTKRWQQLEQEDSWFNL